MLNPEIYSLFKNGSTTYFYSSVFFPKRIKEDVFILYSFVRKADDFVDAIPQQSEAFYAFKKEYKACINGAKSDDIVIESFVSLIKRKNFQKEWVNAFLDAMESDITKKVYKNLSETEKYMYGSAEVIGLMMAAIMNLPKESYHAAQMLGKAMQYINFIRDIQEDTSFGRTYLPENDLKNFGLKSLEYEDVIKNKSNFEGFMRQQLAYYLEWQLDAEKGFHFIPKRYRIPIQTASDMYKWTASVIQKNPFIVYEKKVKPTKGRVFARAAYNFATL